MLKKATIKTISAVFVFVIMVLVASPSVAQASNVVVNYPVNGQEFAGNDITVSGVADPDSTVVIIRNNLTIAQTRSDSSGAWSTHLSGLPDGSNVFTARSIKNTGHGYYVDSPDGTTVRISRLDLGDNSVNSSAPYPVTMSTVHYGLSPSPSGTKFYTTLNVDTPSVPELFDTSSPANPVAVANYPTGKSPNLGAFSLDGTKYYSPNNGEHTVSIVNVADNSWISNIDVGQNATTAWRGVNGNIYVNTEHTIAIIDPSTDTVVKTVTPACEDYAGASVTFSQDSTYPYYFTFCRSITSEKRKLLKYSLATDELIASSTIDFDAINGVLNADNGKLYVAGAGDSGGDADKIRVFDTASNALSKSITTHAGVIAIFQSPDLQHIYAATPSYNFNQTGFDIVDMFTDTVEHIETNSIAAFISAPSTAATLSNVNVAVVLGVKTTSSQLAKTGMFVALASPIGLFLVGAALYTFTDYKRHKQPLLAVDPNVNYSYFHHLKVVSIPLVKYRFSISVDRRIDDHSDDVRRF